MIRKINLAKILVKDVLAFIKLIFYIPPKNQKALWVNFNNPQLYHRFFYLVLKFYKVSGYNIYYPMNFSTFRNLRNKDTYLGLIVHTKNFLSINKKNVPDNFIEINDSMFSPDYFSDYFDNQELSGFHIPMSFHPFMYSQELWNLKIITDKNRFNSIFCYGNFDSKAYLNIKRTQFKVIPRTELLNFFENKDRFVSIRSKEEITNVERKHMNEKFVFAVKENYAIEMNDVRELLSYFNFYLCCPGVIMPLCHNIIEAMSVGTIPLIEKEYARVMYPNLKHKVNAIIFENLNDLEIIVSDVIFNLSKYEILEMRNNVLEYYQSFLKPESVVKNINKAIQNKKLIYLQAEHRSIKFLK